MCRRAKKQYCRAAQDPGVSWSMMLLLLLLTWWLLHAAAATGDWEAFQGRQITMIAAAAAAALVLLVLQGAWVGLAAGAA